VILKIAKNGNFHPREAGNSGECPFLFSSGFPISPGIKGCALFPSAAGTRQWVVVSGGGYLRLKGIEVPSAELPEADRGRAKLRGEENLFSETRGIVRAGRESGRSDGADSLTGNLAS